MKLCVKCKIEKNEKEFTKDKRRKDGLRAWCKQCNNEYYQEYYKTNKEKIKEYQKENRIQLNNERFNINTAPEELKPILKQLKDIRITKAILSKNRKKVERGEI